MRTGNDAGRSVLDGRVGTGDLEEGVSAGHKVVEERKERTRQPKSDV